LRSLPAAAMFLSSSANQRVWIYMVVLMGGYIFYDLVTGQVSGLVIFATVMVYVCWRKGQVYRAAAALGLGIAFKILPAVCLLFFLVKRQWRMSLTTVCFTIVLSVVPGICIFGARPFAESWKVYYKNVVLPKSNPATYEGEIRWTKPATFLNPSLNVTVLRWLSDYPQDKRGEFLPVVKLRATTAQWVYRGIAFVLGLITFWFCRSKPDDEEPEALAVQYGLVLLWMVLVSPHLGIYYMVWALWPVAVMKGLAVRYKISERRSDRINNYPLRLWIAGFPLSTITFFRAIGIHPALLLMLWVVMVINLVRGQYFVEKI